MLCDVGHPQDAGRALASGRGHGARSRGYGRLVQGAGGAGRAQDGEQHWEEHQAMEQAKCDGEAEHLKYLWLLSRMHCLHHYNTAKCKTKTREIDVKV